jgi:hypothetical protein
MAQLFITLLSLGVLVFGIQAIIHEMTRPLIMQPDHAEDARDYMVLQARTRQDPRRRRTASTEAYAPTPRPVLATRQLGRA